MADIETMPADQPTEPLLPAVTPHMRKAADVLSNWAARAAGTGVATAALLPWSVDPRSWPQLWCELWQMQDAVWQRQRQLQDNWVRGWLIWADECTRARGANTMSKLVAQEFDLVAQWHELVSDQATDVVSLLENLEINYAYWVNEKLR